MVKGKLYLSYFNKLDKGIGKKFSISLYPPKLKKGLLDGELKQLAPNKRLFNDYKYNGLSFDKYKERYLSQIDGLCDIKDGKPIPKKDTDLYKITNMLDSGQDVTVYCYEADFKQCHRYFLGMVMTILGYKVFII